MVRVSRNLRHAGKTLFCAAALVGCGSSGGGDDVTTTRANLIQFSPMYSAYDGVHDYKLTPSVPTSAADSKDSDPVMGSTMKWSFDDAYVKAEDFGDLPGAKLLTTKKAGTTTVSVTATTKSGLKVKGTAMLTISQASDADWQKGDARYNNGMAIDWSTVIPMGGPGAAAAAAAADGGGAPPATMCGFPASFAPMIPKSSACGNCHNAMSGITVEHTPTQTAGYSNEQLIDIFTQGMKPAGGTFNSPFLKNLPMPDCIYKSFHTWEIDDDTKNGIVDKLRSLSPAVQPSIDFARLGMMVAAQRAANAGSAAPSDGAAGAGQ
jgi:hypothetical protein